LFFVERSSNKLTLTCAVRRSDTVSFAASADNAQTATIDGVTYIMEGSVTLDGSWNSPVTHVTKSNSPPIGSGWPTRGDTDGWECHSFSAFDGLGGKGFLRARVTAP